MFNQKGTWRVYTEGDCEGKTIKELGTHSGDLLDIAKELSGQAYYCLTFERLDQIVSKPRQTQSKSKCVHFNITDPNVKLFDKTSQIFALTPHLKSGETIGPSNYYGSVVYKWED